MYTVLQKRDVHKNHEYFPNPYFEESGRPTAALSAVLAATDIVHDGTLASIVQKTQKPQHEGGWLRTAERWDCPKQTVETHLFEHICALGVVDEIAPSQTTYDDAVILGSTITGMRANLAYLMELYNRGVRFEKLLFLVGQRPRNSREESDSVVLDGHNGYLAFKEGWKLRDGMPNTETDMARIIMEQSVLPAAWDTLEVIYVDTPMQKKPDGSMRRPTTEDTIHSWCARGDKPGTALVVSSQPHTYRQALLVHAYMPAEYKIECVGRPVQKIEKLNAAVLFDSLARTLYTMLQLQQQSECGVA
jgi:hypothetical protein